jgi:hypothetical protein
LLGESFNIVNHQNVTGVNTLGYTLGTTTVTSGGVTTPTSNTLTFNTSPTSPQTPLFGAVTSTNSSNFQFAPRQIQIGARLQF